MYKRYQGIYRVYFSHFSVHIFMFLSEIPDNLIYYVCLKENLVLEEELSHSVAWVSTTILLIW